MLPSGDGRGSRTQTEVITTGILPSCPRGSPACVSWSNPFTKVLVSEGLVLSGQRHQAFTALGLSLHLELISPAFAQCRYQNFLNPSWGSCRGLSELSLLPRSLLRVFLYIFPLHVSEIKSWLETYSFYAWITPIFSARGSSFFLTALLLVCWESLIACESFFCPPKLILFSKNFDFCLLNFTVWLDTCKHTYIGFRVALIFFFVSIFFYRC